MLHARRLWLMCVLFLISLAAFGKDPEYPSVGGEWKMVVNGASQTLTIDQSGGLLWAVLKNDVAEVKFTGSFTDKHTFSLIAEPGSGEGLRRRIELDGAMHKKGKMSGTMTVHETLNSSQTHISWSNVMHWVAERQ